MVTQLPMDNEQIARAAQEMIERHDGAALAQVDKRIGACKAEGFVSVARTWELIREVIKDIQQSDATVEGYKKALGKSVFLSE